MSFILSIFNGILVDEWQLTVTLSGAETVTYPDGKPGAM
jgi:hypothetical protein